MFTSPRWLVVHVRNAVVNRQIGWEDHPRLSGPAKNELHRGNGEDFNERVSCKRPAKGA